MAFSSKVFIRIHNGKKFSEAFSRIKSLNQEKSFETPRKTLLGSALLVAVLTVLWSSYVQQYKLWKRILPSQTNSEGFVCLPQPYTTEIVSIDPLLIYINNFTTSIESHAIISAGYLSYLLSLFLSYLKQLTLTHHLLDRQASANPKSSSITKEPSPKTAPPKQLAFILPFPRYHVSSPAHALSWALCSPKQMTLGSRNWCSMRRGRNSTCIMIGMTFPKL